MRRLLRLANRFSGVGTASIAQGTQSITTLIVSVLAARVLGIEALGLFSILYGSFVLAAGITTGFVGDSMMVLDRYNRPIRAGLVAWFIALALLIGSVGFLVCWLGGVMPAAGALAFALAAISYISEDLVRRCHMAILGFARIILMDLAVLVVTCTVIATVILTGRASIETFLISIVCGQVAGMLLGWFLLPATERGGVSGPIAWRPVAVYGFWRAALQGLRPGQLTLIRFIVIGMISLAAAGSLEAARIYASPAMLLVTGTCSYLFAHMARGNGTNIAKQLRDTDSAVMRLVGATVFCTVVGLLLLPWGGPLITGILPSGLAVSGWLFYAMAIAVSTPYGLLAAVRDKARAVFIVRVLDCSLSLGLVIGVVLIFKNYDWVPWAAALGALAGGYSIRRFVVGALVRDEQEKVEAILDGASSLLTTVKDHDHS